MIFRNSNISVINVRFNKISNPFSGWIFYSVCNKPCRYLFADARLNEPFYEVDEVDPLLCPACGGQMSIISFIEDHKVIDKIIDHLKLTFMAERPPPPQRVQQELLMAAEEREEYF